MAGNSRLRTMKTLRIGRKLRQSNVKVLYKNDFPADALVDVRKVPIGDPESGQIEVIRVTVTVARTDEVPERRPKIKEPLK